LPQVRIRASPSIIYKPDLQTLDRFDLLTFDVTRQ
jgi:hypothetical protein